MGAADELQAWEVGGRTGGQYLGYIGSSNMAWLCRGEVMGDAMPGQTGAYGNFS